MDVQEFVTEEGIGRVTELVDLLVIGLAELYRILAQCVDCLLYTSDAADE